MREILFKAKVKEEPSDWVEGYLSKCEREFIISDDDGVGVFIVPETICQYTGLTDKNGNKIWENDIMKYEWDGKMRIEVIKYQAPIFTYDKSFRWSLHEDEVIGNKFDNADLLEGE